MTRPKRLTDGQRAQIHHLAGKGWSSTRIGDHMGLDPRHVGGIIAAEKRRDANSAKSAESMELGRQIGGATARRIEPPRITLRKAPWE